MGLQKTILILIQLKIVFVFTYLQIYNMSLIKSDSVLIGTSPTSSSDSLVFLENIIDYNFKINYNMLTNKYLGSNTDLKSQFISPSIDLEFSFLQTFDFYNENKFYLNTSNASLPFLYYFNTTPTVATNYNYNILMLIADQQNADFLKYIYSKRANAKINYINFETVYLEKYNLSYSNNSLPVVNIKFSADTLNSSSMVIEDFSSILRYTYLNNLGISRIFYNTYFDALNIISNYKKYYFEFLLSVTTKLGSGLLEKVASILNGQIQSLEINLDINRQNLYFLFQSKNTAHSKPAILPIMGSLKISGISTNQFSGNIIDNFYVDYVFDFSIQIFKDKLATGSTLKITNAKI
jgi:hypothetical protein